MFGKLHKKNLLIATLLLGFCFYILRLFLEKDINLYIHPRYTLFAVVMCLIGFAILIIGVVLEIKKRAAEKEKFSIKFVDSVVMVVLALAFVLPAQALSSKAIGRKTLIVPTYDTKQLSEGETCPEPIAKAIEAWVSELSYYPSSCYGGQAISIEGFVVESDENPLPADMYYLGRVVLSCCVVDARPYALPIQKGNFQSYPKETWLRVDGTLEIVKVNGAEQLVVKPSAVAQIKDPKQPYEFINTQPLKELEELKPL